MQACLIICVNSVPAHIAPVFMFGGNVSWIFPLSHGTDKEC